MNQSRGAALRQAIGCLERHGVSEPRAVAEVLLSDLLGTTRPRLYLDAACPLRLDQQAAYSKRVQRRLCGEPVQYITGKQEFWSLEFAVSPQVLIPRPESEVLVEQGARLAQEWCALHPQAQLAILDVGTGSGNLAISLAYTLPQAHLWAVDRACGALQVAQQNAQRLGVAARLHWICNDLVTAFQAGRHFFALCVANLPYVTTAEWQSLPQEIKDYEPPGALCGGRDGLELIRRLIAASPAVLAPDGVLLLEVGWQQATAVQEIVRQQEHFSSTGVYYDGAGLERVVWARVL
jgi:release factor glutamine methyltransferase